MMVMMMMMMILAVLSQAPLFSSTASDWRESAQMSTPGSFKVKIRWPKPPEATGAQATPQTHSSRAATKKRKAQRDSPTGQNPPQSLPAKKAKKGAAPAGGKPKRTAAGGESGVELRGRRRGAGEGGSEGEGGLEGGAGGGEEGRVGRGVSRVRSQGGASRSGEGHKDGNAQKAGGKSNTGNNGNANKSIGGGGEEGRGGCVKGQEVPRKEDLKRVVDHVQKQDKNEIFKDPVTEDVVSVVLQRRRGMASLRGFCGNFLFCAGFDCVGI